MRPYKDIWCRFIWFAQLFYYYHAYTKKKIINEIDLNFLIEQNTNACFHLFLFLFVVFVFTETPMIQLMKIYSVD